VKDEILENPHKAVVNLQIGNLIFHAFLLTTVQSKLEEYSVAVRIRMKKMGRRHRPFFRVCAVDSRAPRDGRVIEELGYYDPMVKETDARASLNGERIDYWLGVGAQPSEKVKVLIKKYGSSGTHLEQQQAAFERLKIRTQAPPAVVVPLPKSEAAPAEAAAETEAAAPAAAEESTEAPAETETPAAKPAAEADTGETSAEETAETSEETTAEDKTE
jgi:small subunit ribosomal protein S16